MLPKQKEARGSVARWWIIEGEFVEVPTECQSIDLRDRTFFKPRNRVLDLLSRRRGILEYRHKGINVLASSELVGAESDDSIRCRHGSRPFVVRI